MSARRDIASGAGSDDIAACAPDASLDIELLGPGHITDHHLLIVSGSDEHTTIRVLDIEAMGRAVSRCAFDMQLLPWSRRPDADVAVTEVVRPRAADLQVARGGEVARGVESAIEGGGLHGADDFELLGGGGGADPHVARPVGHEGEVLVGAGGEIGGHVGEGQGACQGLARRPPMLEELAVDLQVAEDVGRVRGESAGGGDRVGRGFHIDARGVVLFQLGAPDVERLPHRAGRLDRGDDRGRSGAGPRALAEAIALPVRGQGSAHGLCRGSGSIGRQLQGHGRGRVGFGPH
ncbi:hypothetical protein HYZ80_03465 [Candidatus Parcubacteria bacterium]|nr:hypothetical protein [Candidatus Parcubacteria bacterium]